MARDAYTHPNEMEPLLPTLGMAKLPGLAIDLAREAGALSGRLHPLTQKSVATLLRNMNSYYSNLIEGNRTHPREIEKALRNSFSRDARTRALQHESMAHVEVQELMEARLREDPNINICSAEFLCWIHREFYKRLPEEFLSVRNDDTGQTVTIVPGSLRRNDVVVGHHVPPRWDTLPAFMERFESKFNPQTLTGTERIIALAASHQRLLWIHPFLDGNGRVSRLFSHAYLTVCALHAEGIWTVARGLSRTKDTYFSLLDSADLHRQGALDGRGPLSDRALGAFCEYFLFTCIDQIRFMQRLLDFENIQKTFRYYLESEKISLHAVPLLVALLQQGEIPRGEVKNYMGVKEVRARQILRKLVDVGLLTSEKPRTPVRIAFPAAAAEIIFPKLFPAA